MRTVASFRCAISQTVTGLVTMAFMTTLIRFVLLCLMVGGAFAQSSLPPCQGDVSRWTNCFGTETYSNVGKYVGEYQESKRSGQGTYHHLADNQFKGDKYVGEFKDGKFHGQGTETFTNGIKYVGEFNDDKRNGQGITYKADGTVASSGNWTDGKLVNRFAIDTNRFPFNPPSPNTTSISSSLVDRDQSQLPACTSIYKHNCFGTVTNVGKKYVGEFKDDKPNGLGIEYNQIGRISGQGRWENSALVQFVTLDTKRFPFNLSQAVAEVPDPVKAERDRFAADLAEARKKQLELEERLSVVQASNKQDNRPVTNLPSERRVALVIGNATYKVNPLKNPVNDSNDIARSLRSVGFDVIEVNNATLVQMREATRRFADKLSNSDVGLVYYSGHGVEVRGKNYLIPVNADIKREYEVVDQAFDASQFLEMMDNIRGPNNKRVNILIVDACRNNELQRSWRSTTNGLARMDAPGGTFISFATAPGRVAADGVGRNSPYTKHLLQALKQPNMPIEQVFKVVRRNVIDETKGEQIPWENSSLVGDFFFTVQR